MGGWHFDLCIKKWVWIKKITTKTRHAIRC